MKTINANLTQFVNKRYRGSIESAPMWVRSIVAPWYRRLLMWPVTIYLVVIAGIYLTNRVEGWMILLLIPSYVLLLTIASKAQIAWYEQIYQEYEDKHPVNKEAAPSQTPAIAPGSRRTRS